MLVPDQPIANILEFAVEGDEASTEPTNTQQQKALQALPSRICMKRWTGFWRLKLTKAGL